MKDRNRNQSLPDLELMLLEKTIQRVSMSDLTYIRSLVTNFLIAIKSKPLIILTGPPESEKEKLVEDFNHILIGKKSYQFQVMVGHPWWATKSLNVVENIQFQSRFNTLKLEALLEEAGLFQNQDRMFIAMMAKISPGELLEYFSETAFQLKHGQLMRLPGSHFSDPVAFPNNLSLIGTMDKPISTWVDSDLFPQTTVLSCSPINFSSSQILKESLNQLLLQKTLLQSFIRTPQQAFRKVSMVTSKLSQALLPLLQVTRVLRKELSHYAGNFLGEGIIYLANSWSHSCNGLFSKDPQKNLLFALDMAISQSLFLPCSNKISQSENLQKKLHKVLGNKFPNSSAYLYQITQ